MKNTIVLIVGLLSTLSGHAQSSNNEVEYFIDDQSADIILMTAYPEERVILDKVLYPKPGSKISPDEKAAAQRILNRIRNDLASAKPMMTSIGN